MPRHPRDIDESGLRDKGIRQLQAAVDLAYEMFRDKSIDLRTRQGWFEKYTGAVLALNQLLRDRQDAGWERRLRELEEYRKNIKRIIQQSGEPPGSSGTPGKTGSAWQDGTDSANAIKGQV